jgi:hypothetical protein
MPPTHDHVHPLQPLCVDQQGRIRFVSNPIVELLLDHCSALPKPIRIDMNEIALRKFSPADREQFAQLIGYDLNGFSDLSYVSEKTFQKALEAAEALSKAHAGNKKRDV